MSTDRQERTRAVSVDLGEVARGFHYTLVGMLALAPLVMLLLLTVEQLRASSEIIFIAMVAIAGGLAVLRA